MAADPVAERGCLWARPLPSPSSQALSAGLFTTLSPCSHGLEPGTGVFTNLLCLLWGGGGGLLVRRVSGVSQEETMGSADVLLLESVLSFWPPLAYKLSQALQHLGQTSWDFGIR